MLINSKNGGIAYLSSFLSLELACNNGTGGVDRKNEGEKAEVATIDELRRIKTN